MATPTRKQKRLIKELQKLYDLLSLDFYDIEAYPRNQTTVRLELMKRAAVRQEVVTACTHIDEYLASELCVHFFGVKKSFPELWKTKRFQLFNSHFLEEVSLIPKFRYVKSLKRIPRSVAADIERLNALRNAVAHSFFPENVKRTRAEWKGTSVFTPEGIEKFTQDIYKVKIFFQSMRRNRY